MKNKTTKIYIFFASAIICFALLVANKTQAAWFGINSIGGGVVGSAMDSAFSKLGVDQNELKYTIKTANVSRRKKQQPQLEMSFTPENPATGQKVTAVATPSYFLNSMESLYFTWYLKPNGCPDDKDNSPSQSMRDKCDFDGDGKISINDYKVKAARILAGNDFEWDKPGAYSSENGGKSYNAIWGGADQNGKNNHCFVHDINSGDEYEIICDEHLFAHTYIDGLSGEIGNGSFGWKDEKFFHTDPNDPDTADSGNGDEANVIGMGINSFSWTYEKGDKVGVVIEGISDEPTQNTDSSYKIMWALVNNKCDIGSLTTGYPKTETVVSDPVSLGTGVTCPDGSDMKKQTTTTTTQTLLSQIAGFSTIRFASYKTDITDSDCDGIFGDNGEVPGAAYDQSTTCPNGPDYNGQCLGISCYDDGFDKSIDLNTANSSLSKVSKTSDINNCLYENFADPAEGGGVKTKMDINLAYSPDFPMNDDPAPSNSTYNNDGDGDQITIQSDIINADNPGYLKYAWQLFESDTPNPESWGDEINATTRLPDNLQKTGIGLTSLKLRLNIPNLKKYLKVKLTASETAGGSEIRTGHADVVIPVSKISASQRIKAYGTTATAPGNTVTLTPKDSNPKNDELCMNSAKTKPDAVCFVAKNEIISLATDDKNLSDLLWTVNGNPIAPIQSGNIAYLPILEENGTRYSVEMTANSSNGDKVDLVKTFEVADPEVNIVSADTNVCKPNLLGHYIDLDGTPYADYSKTNFSAVTGSKIKLQAQFDGISPTPDQYSWLVDGISITATNASDFGYSIDNQTGILSLSGKDTVGESYGVAVGGIYSQDSATKKALSKFWGVTPDKFYEKKVSSAIQIAFVGSISDMANKDNAPKKILASLYSATPAYIAFLLRIVLTAFAMLIFSKIVLSFLPNIKQQDF